MRMCRSAYTTRRYQRFVASPVMSTIDTYGHSRTDDPHRVKVTPPSPTTQDNPG